MRLRTRTIVGWSLKIWGHVVGLFDSSKYRLTQEQATWVFRVIHDSGLAGSILIDQMDPRDRLHLSDCLYEQMPKSNSERGVYLSSELQRLQELSSDLRSGNFTHLPHSEPRLKRVRAMLDEYEALTEKHQFRNDLPPT